MKTSSIVIASLCIGLAGLQAQPAAKAKPADTDYAVTERGANHRVWQRTTYEQGPNGKMFPHVHSYTELATGMHYKDAQTGQWLESKEEIEAYPSGAIARQGQYQVIFANNLNSAGAIDMQTPDGKRLRSNILGLMYHDTATDEAVLIARLQDSTGELISSNQVLYPDAFEGVKADVRYTHRKGSFEQDVILREQPPAPEVYGMNPDTTEIEVMTEFINPPAAQIISDQNKSGQDDDVNWGSMRIGRGKTFDLDSDQNVLPQTQVIKRYVAVQGRHILLEKVRMHDVQPALNKLPKQASSQSKLKSDLAKNLVLPRTPSTQAEPKPIKLAKSATAGQGYVLDYMGLNTDQTDFTFQGNMTYCISGQLNLNGTTTIEGGTVIKYYSGAGLYLTKAPICRTGPYRPAVLTAIDDDSVGEGISGSTGQPSGFYADIALNFWNNATNSTDSLQYLRFAYASWALAVGHGANGGLVPVRHCQFVNTDSVFIWEDQVALENVLFYNVGNVFRYNEYSSACNITAHNVNNFLYSPLSVVSVTNSLFISVTNFGGAFVSCNNVTNADDGGIFQTVGAGNHYLAINSVNRNTGTTNINPALLADLRNKTTYPPIVYSNTTISVATTFAPQAQRDTNANATDLGYHYDPLDYVFGAAVATSNQTFTAGTAVGYFYNSGGGTYALALGDSVTAAFNGTVTSPCRWVKSDTVQEGGNGVWTSQSWLGGITGQSFTYAAPAVRANFTICSVPAGEGNLFRDNWTLLNICATNCEFWTGSVAGYYSSLNLVNCLFVNDYVGLWWNYGAANITMQGCTMIRGNFYADHDHSGDWPVTIVNCAFDGTIFYMNPHSNSTNGYYSDYNTFLSGSNRTYFAGSHDLTINNGYNWQSSSLGDFYLPTNSPLINAGSITADQIGLYHFTTQTNQVKEASSTVDVGYHYVAVDGNGNPIDSNGDGIPDYLEDPNGNGLTDSGEAPFGITIVNPINGAVIY